MDAHFDSRTLFWQTVPLFMRRGDRDEALQELNVRVISSSLRGSRAVKVSTCKLSENKPNHLQQKLTFIPCKKHYRVCAYMSTAMSMRSFSTP